jgi:2-oxoglutarate ferredoxin oxidoreductase subunit delta
LLSFSFCGKCISNKYCQTFRKGPVREKILIDEEFCKGCGLCAEACPKKLLKIGRKLNKQGYPLVEIDQAGQEKCISCALCARICPDVAIKVNKSDD